MSNQVIGLRRERLPWKKQNKMIDEEVRIEEWDGFDENNPDSEDLDGHSYPYDE